MERELALVTGGARGIGRACCQALLDSGRRVVFLDQDEAGAQAFLAQAHSDTLHYFPCNVTRRQEVDSVCQQVRDAFGPVSILVNNAGIQTHCAFLELTEQLWDDTLNVNLKSAFYTCKCLAPDMVARGYGRNISISSMSARRGSRNHVHYCASKAALLGFTRALSLELAPHGVTVNAICPGIVETDMIRETLPKRQQVWLEEMHVKRLGAPGDIANAVLFLAQEASGWITGQALDVNGGILTP